MEAGDACGLQVIGRGVLALKWKMLGAGSCAVGRVGASAHPSILRARAHCGRVAIKKRKTSDGMGGRAGKESKPQTLNFTKDQIKTLKPQNSRPKNNKTPNPNSQNH